MRILDKIYTQNNLKKSSRTIYSFHEDLNEDGSNKTKIFIRSREIIINKIELRKIKKQLKARGYSFKKLRKIIGKKFEWVYKSYKPSMDDINFKKLEKIIGRKIPHRVKLGQKKILEVVENEDLAELTCILLGDGGIYTSPYLTKYELTIFLNRIDEKRYIDYVNTLFYKLFQYYLNEYPKKNEKTIVLQTAQKSVVKFFISKASCQGDKVKNQVSVPEWIKKHKNFIIRGLKGLFDADGSIWVNFSHKAIYLTFRNASLNLAKDFKRMCEILDIRTQPKITEFHKIDEITGKEVSGYQVFISSKYFVKKFLKVVKPEKWKDPLRHLYIGTVLILLNSKQEIQEKVFMQTEIDFPNMKDRRFTSKFANYLSNICRNYGCEINNLTITKAIIGALEYKVPMYQKEDAEILKFLFEKLGSFKAFRDYEINQGNISRKAEQIAVHIRRLFKEASYRRQYGIDGFERWYDNNRDMILDQDNKKFIKFQLRNKRLICREIFKLLTNTGDILDYKQVIEKSKIFFLHKGMSRITLLLEGKGTKTIMENYIKIHISMIEYILEHREEIDHPTRIYHTLKMPVKQNHIKELLYDIKNHFNHYFETVS